jgi:hypothetical protein
LFLKIIMEGIDGIEYELYKTGAGASGKDKEDAG